MSKLIIDILSDTHNQHKKFICTGGDILIHAGDATLGGKHHEICHFLDWYAKQKYDHLIFVAGNHDWGFEKEPNLMKEECDNRNIILLNDSGVIITSGSMEIKMWGSPVQPWFHSWAFNRDRGEDIKRHWDLIPDDTEILITHGPPYGILDHVIRTNERVGCYDLLDKILKTQVKLHTFGHIHEARGNVFAYSKQFINASSLNGMYYPYGNKPIRVIRETLEDNSILYTIEE